MKHNARANTLTIRAISLTLGQIDFNSSADHFLSKTDKRRTVFKEFFQKQEKMANFSPRITINIQLITLNTKMQKKLINF